MTKEEAEKKVSEFKVTWFCPVINAACREDCLCYNKPKVYEEVESYTHKITGICYAYDGYCSNYSLIGPQR